MIVRHWFAVPLLFVATAHGEPLDRADVYVIDATLSRCRARLSDWSGSMPRNWAVTRTAV